MGEIWIRDKEGAEEELTKIERLGAGAYHFISGRDRVVLSKEVVVQALEAVQKDILSRKARNDD